MPYDSNLITQNNASREHMRALLARLDESQYALPLGNDWTIGTALLHVAVFDRRAIEILERWEREGVSPSPNDADIINATLRPFFRAVPAAAIPKLAMEFADALDAKLAALPDAVLDQFETVAAHPFNLSRAAHRNEHLEQIERALRST